MTITKEEQNGCVTLHLSGWLDTLSSPLLGEEIDKITAASSITLDLNDVEYIASSGLREAVACHRKAKEMGASFAIVNVCTEIMSIFKLTGLDKKLDIRAK